MDVIIIAYAKKLLNIEFQSTGRQRYSAFCPFHNDSKDSFRVYVDSKDEVRFHCFGACNTERDIIIKVNKCSFREAQETFAEYMGITDFVFYGGIASMPGEENKYEQIIDLYKKYTGNSLQDSYQKIFDDQLPELLNENHQIVIILIKPRAPPERPHEVLSFRRDKMW